LLDLLLKLIQALLASLYTLFEGVPALDALRSWFGPEGGAGTPAAGLFLAGLALLFGLAAFLVVLWLLRRAPKGGPRPSPAGRPQGERAGDGEPERAWTA
jgi:hypothetical protein